MLKARIIPVLTFNGFGLVKTKQFKNARMVGNPVQAARVYNMRGVDELVFLDIFASKQKRKINLKLVGDVIKECYMPVAIGGGIESINDINDLLKIGADKVVIKNKAIHDLDFVKKSVNFFGSQCITIAIDVIRKNNQFFIYNETDAYLITLNKFLEDMDKCQVGELILNSVEKDGMMNGFDIELVNYVNHKTSTPVIALGGGGDMSHYSDLFKKTKIEAVASSSIFHFTQHTPLDIKNELKSAGIPVRI